MLTVFVFMVLERLHSKANVRPKPSCHQKCILKSVDIYLFKSSEQLLQAEIQANHIGVCARTPPTPSSAYIFSTVIQVEDRQGVRTGR